MSSIKKWLPGRGWLVLPPIVVGILVVAVLARSKQALPRTEPRETAIPVDVLTVDEVPVRPSAIGYGTARPKNVWTAVAEVGGRAVEIHPDLRTGNEINASEVLVKIDPTDYQLRIQQRTAERSQAEAQLEQLVQGERSDAESLKVQQELLKVRKTEAARLRELRGNAAASQSESDNAEAAYLQQELAVQTLKRTIALMPAQQLAAQAAIQLARAKLDEARRDLERTTLRAPFDGLLSGVDLQPQQYLAPGQSLFELHDIATVEVEAQFSLAQMSRLVAIGDDPQESTEIVPHKIKPAEVLAQLTATVTVRSGDVAVEFRGQPVRASGTIDEETRTLGIVVEVDSTGQLDERRTVALRSGAYCEVVLARKAEARGILIPRTALRSGGVFLVNDTNRLQHHQVTVRGRFGKQLLVAGLSPGVRLVANPPLQAADGLLIEAAEFKAEEK